MIPLDYRRFGDRGDLMHKLYPEPEGFAAIPILLGRSYQTTGSSHGASGVLFLHPIFISSTLYVGHPFGIRQVPLQGFADPSFENFDRLPT